MQTQLSSQAKALHEQAIALSREHRMTESRLVQTLAQIDRFKLYRHLGCASLFNYVVSILGFTEAAAYQLITVTRKAKDIGALRVALDEGRLSAAKASRIVAVLNAENAAELIDYANRHTSRETDLEVARRAGREGKERQRSLKISVRVFAKLKHVQTLMGKNAIVDFETMLEKLADYYIDREDPVQKAQRALAKKPENSERSESSNREASKRPLKRRIRQKRARVRARELHAVTARDGRRCTFKDAMGTRCPNEHWLHIHHLLPVSEGGTNDPENLTTLCTAHHEMVHQVGSTESPTSRSQR